MPGSWRVRSSEITPRHVADLSPRPRLRTGRSEPISRQTPVGCRRAATGTPQRLLVCADAGGSNGYRVRLVTSQGARRLTDEEAMMTNPKTGPAWGHPGAPGGW